MNDLHSLIARLEALDIELWDDDGHLGYSAPEGALTPELLGKLRDNRDAILALLQQGTATAQELRHQPHAGLVPIAPAQLRLWYLSQLEGANVAYNMPFVTELTGSLDVGALARGLDEMVRRHESLRTTFRLDAEGPMQVIHPPAPVDLVTEDLSSGEGAATEAELERRIFQEAHWAFDLVRGPLLRAHLFKRSADRHILCLVIHHIVGDGWSMGVFVRELAALYGAYVAGRPTPLPEPTLQYADFSRWQQDRLNGNLGRQQLAYWKQKLAQLDPLQLPTDRPRPTVESFRGGHLFFHIGQELTRDLHRLSREEGVTLYVTVLAAFDVLLARYSRQDDIAVSSGTANRKHPAFEGLIGFFVNTLAIRCDLSDNPTFRVLLGRVRQSVNEAFEHDDLPFERVVEELRPERTASQSPLAQVALTLQSFASTELSLPGLASARWDKIRFSTSKFDLMLLITEVDAELEVVFEYNTDLFDRTTVERMGAHYQNILRHVVRDRHTPVGGICLLDDADRRVLIEEWNQTEAPFSSQACIHQLFEAHADRSPNAIAVVDLCGPLTGTRGHEISYRELESRANQVAHTLIARGIQPETLIGIFLPRGVDLIVALLGVLKAGGVVAVLDPDHPRKRIERLLEDTGVSTVISRGAPLTSGPLSGVHLVDLDHAAEQPVHRPPSRVHPHHLAYVLYTSGSTGTPNGALIEHRGLVNSTEAHIQIMGIGPGARLLHVLSFNFDAAMAHLFDTIGAGATLFLAPRASDILGQELLDLIDRERITHTCLVPSLLAALPDAELPSLKTLAVGGEKSSAELVARWGRNRRFINVYGPTEVSILATSADVPPDGSTPLIGRPIANIQAYVVDRFGQLAPPGTVGELWLGGIGVARGYLNRPELTARKFIPNPFLHGQGRVYRTGDLVRYRPTQDGLPALEFIGRTDDQVKIRGQRVELAEVDSALRASPRVRDSVVTVQKGAAAEDARLVGYVTLAPRPRNTQWEIEQVDSWRALSSRIDASPDPELALDLRGWKSSFTGQDIPVEQMRTWAEFTVARILDLRPRRVLEVGCGTGMLLARIAPRVQSYRGTDLARHAVEQVAALRTRLPGLDNVLVTQQPAHDRTGLSDALFDTVILNSVVQYFPSAEYLVDVIAGLLPLMPATGAVFLGDIRNLALLDTFHAAVEHARTGGALTQRELRQRMQRALLSDNELVLHPRFFTALQALFPQIVDVEISPKRGLYRNELSLFRYDVTLWIGTAPTEPIPVDWQDAETVGLTLDDLRQWVGRAQPGSVLGLRSLPNARLHAENALHDWATQGGNGPFRMPPTGPAGWEPEALYALESELPCRVRLSWASGDTDGRFDAIITVGKNPLPRFSSDKPQAPARWSDLASDPMQDRAHRELVQTLRRALDETLPPHMVPSAIVVLPALPLTLNGKVDVRALPAPESFREAPTETQELQDETQRQLAALWGSILGLPRVGPHDNFFELGGHSLMAVKLMTRLEAELGHRLPLSALFQAPTVSLLAQRIQRHTTDAGHKSALLTAVQPQGDQLPVLFFAPFGFHAVYFHEIGRQLAPEHPFYLIHPVDIAEAFPDVDSLSVLTARIADVIQARWPQGPYLLSGHSAGVLMALAVAVELEARGHATSLVNMDMSAPRAGRQPSARPRGASTADASIEKLVLGYVLHTPYKGRLVLLAAADADEDGRQVSMAGWQELCEQPVQSFVVPGTHLSMVESPNVRAIVDQLRRAAEEAQIRDSFPVSWAAAEEAQEMWMLDEVHNLGQMSQLDFELRLQPMLEGNSRAFSQYGLPTTLTPKLVHGFVYQRVRFADLPKEELAATLQRSDQTVREAARALARLWEVDWYPEIQRHLATLTAFEPGDAPLPALVDQLGRLRSTLLRLWELHFELLFPVLVALSDFEEAYRDLFPDAGRLDVYELLAGLPNKTLEANLDLWRLGRLAAHSPVLHEVLRTAEPSALGAALVQTAEGAPLWAEIQTHLRKYGERNDDLYIDKPTWIDEPTPVLRSLREVALSPERDLAAELHQKALRRQTRLAEVRGRIASHPIAVVEEFEALLEAAQVATVLSEDHHFWLDCKITYHARRIALETGKRLTAIGLIPDPADVFRLSLAELALLGSDPDRHSAEIRRALDERHADAARFAGVKPPPLLGVPRPLPAGESAILRASFKFNGGFVGSPDGKGELRGMPGSAGRVQGPVRIVRTLADAAALRPGDILVAPATLPSWTPLFATVAAVVTNVGGVLCHAGVVAREYGIPAVVGVRGATETLRGGQVVEVDGDNGIVRPAVR